MDPALKAFILQCYDEKIALSANIPSEMKAALKGSNRVPVFLKNLQVKIEKSNVSKETIREAVYSMTEWFLEAFKKHAEERQMSEVAKQAMLRNQERKEIIETAIETGNITEEVCDVIEEGFKEKVT